MTVHLDTHVVVWLYQGKVDELPGSVTRRLESESLVISPMVLCELDLLHEIGRTAGGSDEVLAGLRQSVGLAVSETSFADVVGAAAELTWTRDPFDRLISAQAIADDAVLLTKDRRIRTHLDRARWG